MLGLRKRLMKRSVRMSWTRYTSTKSSKRAVAKMEDWNFAKPFKLIPAPKSYPLIGNALEFSTGAFKGLSMPEVLKKMESQYGSICKLHGLFGKHTVFLFNPVDMEIVYRTEGLWPWRKDTESITYFRTHFRPDIYKECIGLSVAQGNDWHQIRSKVNPVLMKPEMVKQYITSIQEVADEFILRMVKLRDAKNEMPDDFWNEINNWALETIALIGLNTKLGCLKYDLEPKSDPQRLIQSALDFFELVYQVDVLPSPWKYISTPAYRKTMDVLDTMTTISLKYVNQGMRDIVYSQKYRTEKGDVGVLEKLLQIDRNIAVIMVMDLLLGGVDTVSSSCAIFLYNIAKNQEAQDKIREELRRVLPERTSCITSETLENLPHLKACIKESARVSPITVGNMRRTPRDIVLSGFQIPKGTDVLLCHSIAQQSPAQFPSPNEFIPERWLVGRKGKPTYVPTQKELPLIRSARDAHPFSFMPFGFGPRMCVGKRFADLEMEIFLMRLLRNYRIEWKYDDIKYKASFINVPAGKLKFTMTDV